MAHLHMPAHKANRVLHPHDRKALSMHEAVPNLGHAGLAGLAGAPIAGVAKPDTSVPAPHLPTPVPEAPAGMGSGPAGFGA